MSDTVDGVWICESCGGETRRPPVRITYRVVDEIHDGDLVECEACEEARQDAEELAFAV